MTILSAGIFYTGQGIRVITGATALDEFLARSATAIVSGEISGIAIRSANNSIAPTIEAWNDADFMADIFNGFTAADYNAVTRDALAGVFGIVVGTWALANSGSPATGVAADWLASETFKKTYDAITDASRNYIPWEKVYDVIDEVIDDVKSAASGRDSYYPPTPWNPFNIRYEIDRGANGAWQIATTLIRRDPLAIDLDADGIETVGLTTAPSSSTTTPTASAPAPAGWPRTMPGWCWTATATAASIPAANSLAWTHRSRSPKPSTACSPP